MVGNTSEKTLEDLVIIGGDDDYDEDEYEDYMDERIDVILSKVMIDGEHWIECKGKLFRTMNEALASLDDSEKSDWGEGLELEETLDAVLRNMFGAEKDEEYEFEDEFELEYGKSYAEPSTGYREEWVNGVLQWVEYNGKRFASVKEYLDYVGGGELDLSFLLDDDDGRQKY